MTSRGAALLQFVAREQTMLVALQALLVALPFVGGLPDAIGVAVAGPPVVAMLVLTLDRRLGWRGPETVGLAPLGAFFALAVLSIVALPPSLLALVAPETWRLYAEMLPGWPRGEDWSWWRPLALDPYAACVVLGRLVLGVGIFAVLTAYPWSATLRPRVAPQLLRTLVATGVVLAALGLRGVGPFTEVAPRALWLGMVIPVALARGATLTVGLARRLRDTVERVARNGRGRRRAWVTAVFLHQRELLPPFVAIAAVLLMLVAHGGSSALLLGVTVAIGTVAVRSGAATGRLGRGALAVALALPAVSLLRAAIGGARVQRGALRVVGDFPFLGTGLGAWEDAARRHLLAPANDLVTLAGESGLVGTALIVTFGVAVVRAVWSRSFETPGATTLARSGFARAGLLGGVTAAIAHGVIAPGLLVPANLSVLMLLVGLLVATADRGLADGSPGLGSLTGFAAVAVLFVVLNAGVTSVGLVPLSARDCMARGEQLLRAGEREGALALARRAVDYAPADRAAHETLAAALGSGADGEAALRRALVLDPWAATVRDRLALRLWRRGAREEAAAEVEESVFRHPEFAAHPLLHVASSSPSRRVHDVVRALAADEGPASRVAGLDDELAAAADRGLARALAAAGEGAERLPILEDLVSLREARGRWREAAALLRAEAERDVGSAAGHLARAAADYLKAGARSAAEKTLLAGLLRTPGEGELYRRLAVEVYAAHGELGSADRVLAAGERNADDVMPVRRGRAQVLGVRETTRLRTLVGEAGAPEAWAP